MVLLLLLKSLKSIFCKILLLSKFEIVTLSSHLYVVFSFFLNPYEGYFEL